MPNLLLALPVKPFAGAKRRLQLSPEVAARLGRALAQRTLRTVREAGFDAGVVTGDRDVAAWAEAEGAEIVWEGQPAGLDAAAGLVVQRAYASGRRWGILHTDLPLLEPSDLALSRQRPCLAPSYDGGTSLITGEGVGFPFAYGPGSFGRHLAACPVGARVLVRPGLAYDLDSAADLARASRRASWLGEFFAG